MFIVYSCCLYVQLRPGDPSSSASTLGKKRVARPALTNEGTSQTQKLDEQLPEPALQLQPPDIEIQNDVQRCANADNINIPTEVDPDLEEFENLCLEPEPNHDPSPATAIASPAAPGQQAIPSDAEQQGLG